MREEEDSENTELVLDLDSEESKQQRYNAFKDYMRKTPRLMEKCTMGFAAVLLALIVQSALSMQDRSALVSACFILSTFLLAATFVWIFIYLVSEMKIMKFVVVLMVFMALQVMLMVFVIAHLLRKDRFTTTDLYGVSLVLYTLGFGYFIVKLIKEAYNDFYQYPLINSES